MSEFILCQNLVVGVNKALHEKPINCTISCNDKILLQGENGVGKTTWMRTMLNLEKPIQGNVSIAGKNINSMQRYEIGRKIGYLHQQPAFQLFSMSVWEELVMLLSFREDISNIQEKAHEVAQMLKIDHLYKSHPQLCSKGEQQRIACAAILLQQPSFLFLDEPTSGLDDQSTHILLETLNHYNMGYIMVSHDQRVSVFNHKRTFTLTKEGLHEQVSS